MSASGETMLFDPSRRPVVVRSFALLTGLAASAFVACSSDDEPKGDPKGDPADCRLIANRCHPYDDGSNLAHECHEVGHEGASPAKCSEMRARCEAACPPVDPDAGTGGSGGSSGSGSGGTSPSGGSAGASTGGASGSAGAQTGGEAGEATGGTTTGGSAGQAGSSSGGASAGGGAGGGGAAAGSGGMPNGGRGGAGGSSGRAGGAGRAGSAGSGGTTGETACELLGRVCHDVDEECHELGHDGNEPACEARLAECLAACT